jgi:hypothetical protein
VDDDVLFCSAATPGYLTKVQPAAPNLKVPIATVIHAHPSNGTLFIRPSHFPDLNQINDVQLTSPTTGQTLIYNASTGVWSNQTPADPSPTNELQTLSVAANTATLSSGGGSVTIAGAGINTVGTAGTTITVTGTEMDGSVTNELQTLSAGTNTLTLSNGGGTVTVDTDPASDVTGSGTSGQVSFWTGAQTQSGDGAFIWNNTDKRLGVGNSVSNTGTFNVRGSTNTSTGWTARFSNSANSNSLMVRDDGFVGINTASFTSLASISPLQVNGRGRFSDGVEFGVNAIARMTSVGDYRKLATGTDGFSFLNESSLNPTNGTYGWAIFQTGINPTSGNATIATIALRPTVNITGAATTAAVGIDYNPTLTSLGNGFNYAAIFRSGQVGIGTATPNVSAALDVVSTTQGILFPRMTTAQRDLITTPSDGLVIYNTTDNKLQVRAAGVWVDLH